MIWAGISWCRKTRFGIRRGEYECETYINLRDRYYHPFVEEFYPRGCILQQDISVAHSVQYTKDYFLSEAMDAMDWPAFSQI